MPGKNEVHDSLTPTDHEHPDHPGGHHHFRGINMWVARLDNPEREKIQRPREVIGSLNLRDGDVIADIGVGTGYFALRIAESYPHVKVIAADAQSEMIEYLAARAKAQNYTNLEPLVVHPAEPSLPVKVDLALMVDTLHHITDRAFYLSHLTKSMAPGARVAIIDYRIDAPEGPPHSHRISKEEITSDLEQTGYTLEADLDSLPNQYFMIFRQRG